MSSKGTLAHKCKADGVLIISGDFSERMASLGVKSRKFVDTLHAIHALRPRGRRPLERGIYADGYLAPRL